MKTTWITFVIMITCVNNAFAFDPFGHYVDAQSKSCAEGEGYEISKTFVSHDQEWSCSIKKVDIRSDIAILMGSCGNEENKGTQAKIFIIPTADGTYVIAPSESGRPLGGEKGNLFEFRKCKK